MVNSHAAGGWSGVPAVHEVAQRLFKNSFDGQTASLCGRPTTIDACVDAQIQGRLLAKHIFLERFITKGDAAARPKSPVFKSF